MQINRVFLFRVVVEEEEAIEEVMGVDGTEETFPTMKLRNPNFFSVPLSIMTRHIASAVTSVTSLPVN